MSESLHPSRGFGGEGFKGFKNYIKPKEDSMAKTRPSEFFKREKEISQGQQRMVLSKAMTAEDIPIKENDSKDTNPKDAVGIKKAPISTLSGAVMAELGVAMLEGARKYGRHNYRISGVRASVYRDAAWRHLNKWWEGQDIDPDSGLSHIIKAMASLAVLRDAQIVDNWVDDRPPPIPEDFWEKMDKAAVKIIKAYPNAKDPFTHEHVKNKT